MKETVNQSQIKTAFNIINTADRLQSRLWLPGHQGAVVDLRDGLRWYSEELDMIRLTSDKDPVGMMCKPESLLIGILAGVQQGKKDMLKVYYPFFEDGLVRRFNAILMKRMTAIPLVNECARHQEIPPGVLWSALHSYYHSRDDAFMDSPATRQPSAVSSLIS